MVGITIELIRKRSEHNEGEISTLEELALHQENIDKIQLINRVCKDLRILLLQNNLISKLENLNRLKLLEYLNLALNNIEVIENLEGLENLKKLDLTVNFVGDLRNIKRLQVNEHLEELFLIGNPCADYEGYRDYVVAVLPQLKELDGKEIARSHRIKALQKYAEVEGDVIRGYWNYREIRARQLDRHREKGQVTITEIHKGESDDDEAATQAFWNSTSYHTPEDRREIANKVRNIEERRNKGDKLNESPKYILKLFSPEGRAYNVNQGRIPFRLNVEDDPVFITLEISTYRHLDTALINVDVQPNYVRVVVKGKILQLTLPCEILTDKSKAERNTVTGNLVISMPRMSPLTSVVKRLNNSINKSPGVNQSSKVMKSCYTITKRELLEIGPPANDLDFSKIYRDPKTLRQVAIKNNLSGKKVADNFVDDPNVPPLE
ncbi:protein tilB homolog [Fopius arisanus]|uniref:Protein tilB homolog n=1 Tax=Fopius arisanus TaxID=64838 RepID=A0A9R1UA23_9HYME|nr:PREDICTED: protein tilB homolog [Fopius arisanus]